MHSRTWSRRKSSEILAFCETSADNGRVIQVTEPQVWVLIGVFAAATFGMLTIVSTLFLRIVSTEIRTLDTTFVGRFDRLEQRIEGLARRIDGVDRDVQALVKHTFGLDRS
jgi:hypothetical protein